VCACVQCACVQHQDVCIRRPPRHSPHHSHACLSRATAQTRDKKKKKGEEGSEAAAAAADGSEEAAGEAAAPGSGGAEEEEEPESDDEVGGCIGCVPCAVCRCVGVFAPHHHHHPTNNPPHIPPPPPPGGVDDGHERRGRRRARRAAADRRDSSDGDAGEGERGGRVPPLGCWGPAPDAQAQRGTALSLSLCLSVNLGWAPQASAAQLTSWSLALTRASLA
jgi:hypothetical protein